MSRFARLWVPLGLFSYGCAGEVGSDTPPPGSSAPDTYVPIQYDAQGNPVPGTGPVGTLGPATTPPAIGVADPTLPSPSPTAPPATESDEERVANMPALALKLEGAPLHAGAVRLTHDQWENSVRYLLALDDTGQRGNLAEDASGLYDFTNHEELLFLNANLYRDYQLAAEELVAIIGMDPNAIGRIHPGEDADAFIETVGRRAFRRPLTTNERQALRDLYDAGAALTENGSTPHARGVALVLQALLQSPYFLYRLDTAQPGTRLSGYELAAKLSLLLLSTTPDDALLDRAGNGELDADDAVRSIASEMLESEAAAATMQGFHAELFTFHRFLGITKDPELVPEYNSALNDELQTASYRFFDRIYREGLGFTDILTTTVGFAGPNMAPFYGVNVQGQGVEQVELGAERPGFFTHLPFLVLNAVNGSPDSIHRGVALNNEVLCGEIPPPPNVMISLNAPIEGQTNRERVSATSGVNTCGESCHAAYINPLGFAFENYDGMGRLRDTDNGQPVDTKAAYPFTEGRREFDGATDLMRIIAEGEQAHACYAKHLTTFALQRDLTEEDRSVIDALATESQNGTSLKAMLLSIVTSQAFITRHSGVTQ